MLRRRAVLILALVTLVGLLARPARAERRAAALAEEINRAIDRGIQFVLGKQQSDGSFSIRAPGNTTYNADYPIGVPALCTYTLLKSGVPRTDPAVERALEDLLRRPFSKTYGTSLLVLALDATKDPTHDKRIREAATWLEEQFNPSQRLWGYPAGKPCLSNSQLAVLALWVAEQHGYESDRTIWEQVAQATMIRQNKDGGFGYQSWDRPESAGSMTTAGLTVLHLAQEILTTRKAPKKLLTRIAAAITEAWAWMDRVFTATGNPTGTNGLVLDRFPHFGRNYHFHYYYLYGLERIATFAERRQIGGIDWYRDGALELLRAEQDGGGWEHLENTCLALLFLRRATMTGMKGEGAGAVLRPDIWRYTIKKPAAGWATPSFDDRTWKQGAGGFGHFNLKNAVVRTPWNADDIWIRRLVRWHGGDAETFQLFARHDDGIEVYINGVLATKRASWTPEYEALTISPEARAALVKGENVIAAHCHNVGGAGVLDIRTDDVRDLNSDPAEHRWWKDAPDPDVPCICEWLVWGPVADKSGGLLVDPSVPGRDAQPRAGQSMKGSRWRHAWSPGGLLDLEFATRAKDTSLYAAFTHLVATEDTPAVIRVSADDGVRVILDGTLLLSHHANHKQGTKLVPDELAIPVTLMKGVHALLLKVDETTDRCRLYARVTARDGGPLTTVKPTLDPTGTNLGGCACAHPSLFGFDELLELLPLDTKPKLDFAKQTDLHRVAITPGRLGWPLWRRKGDSRGPRIKAHPGAKGIIGLWSAEHATPMRAFWKVRPTAKTPSLHVRFGSAQPDVRGLATLRLGVHHGDGTVWWPPVTAEATSRAGSHAWRTLRVNLERFVGQDVLIVVEATPSRSPDVIDCLFLDELSLRAAK